MSKLMRAFLVLALVSAGLFFAIDYVALDSRYGRASWQEAKHQGDELNRHIRYLFRKIG